MNNQDFGKFISALRKEKGLTQKELGEKLNLTDKAVSRWENGKSYPDIEIFECLANELGVSISELIACKKIETKEDAEMETAKIFVEEMNKKFRLLGIIKIVFYVLATTFAEIGIGYLTVIIVSNITEAITNTPAAYTGGYYQTMIIIVTFIGLLLSVLGYGLILPIITNRINQKINDVYYILMFSFIIIGAIQIISVSYNGAGIFGLLTNSVNIYPLIVFSTTEGFADVVEFAFLFILGCLCKPICFVIGNKLKHK